MAPIHEDEGNRSVSTARRRQAKGLDKKAGELILVHLSYAHRKVAMADASGAANMTVDRNIVWRIRADEVDGIVTHEKVVGAAVACISTNKFVTTQQPEVAHLRNGGGIVSIRRDCVLARRVGAVS